MDPSEAAKNALECVLEAKKNERLVIFCDDVRANIGAAFHKGAGQLGLQTTYVLLKTSKTVVRKEIPAEHMPLLTTDRPDLFLNLLTGGREETPFRIKLIHAEAGKHQTRLAHCPGITMDMLTHGALGLTAAQHRRMQTFADQLMKQLNNSIKIEISTPSGTSLTFSTVDREFFTDTRIDWKTLKWMNLPTGEVIVAPVENSLEGTLVCDMAIGGIGQLKKPLTITVKNGRVEMTESEDASVRKRVDESLATDAMSKVVGEFAFGINSKARFVEEFLEAEKIKGTVHIAFGDNTDFPSGKNNSANHMDFLMKQPTVRAYIKGSAVTTILENGAFIA